MEKDKLFELGTVIFDCFNFETLKNLVEKFDCRDGYFSNVMSDFSNLKNCYKGKLVSITDNGYCGHPFQADNKAAYQFFVLRSQLKFNDAGRPMTESEFRSSFGLGKKLRIKNKQDEIFEGTVESYKHDINHYYFKVSLCGLKDLTLLDLYENYQYYFEGNLADSWENFKICEN